MGLPKILWAFRTDWDLVLFGTHFSDGKGPFRYLVGPGSGFTFYTHGSLFLAHFTGVFILVNRWCTQYD